MLRKCHRSAADLASAGVNAKAVRNMLRRTSGGAACRAVLRRRPLSLATGRHLGTPRAVAVLTAGYGVGQVIGPLIVAPLLGGGYRPALLVGAVLVLLAALGSALLRVRFPHRGAAHHGDRRLRSSGGRAPH